MAQQERVYVHQCQALKYVAFLRIFFRVGHLALFLLLPAVLVRALTAGTCAPALSTMTFDPPQYMTYAHDTRKRAPILPPPYILMKVFWSRVASLQITLPLRRCVGVSFCWFWALRSGPPPEDIANLNLLILF